MLLELKDAEDIVKTISDMFNEKPALVKKFKIGKTEYGFHPELDSLTLGEYIDLDTFIGDSYDELFGQSGNGTLDAASQFTKKWSWYGTIFALAQGDLRRFQDITKLSMHECFMMLSFMKDKADVESKEIRKKFN